MSLAPSETFQAEAHSDLLGASHKGIIRSEYQCIYHRPLCQMPILCLVSDYARPTALLESKVSVLCKNRNPIQQKIQGRKERK